MRREQQYEALKQLKLELNNKLKELNFEKIKELFIWLAGQDAYHILKTKENSMIMLEFFRSTWIEEKRKLVDWGIKEDVFSGIFSLEDIERKYQIVKFDILRLETKMQQMYYDQIVDDILELHVSGIMLGRMILRESLEHKNNAMKLVDLLNARNQLVTSIFLLQQLEMVYKADELVLSKLAACWLKAEQYFSALQSLKKIENPDELVRQQIVELEEKING